MSTSLRFKLLKFGIGLMGMKKLFALPKEELLKKPLPSTKTVISTSPLTVRSSKCYQNWEKSQWKQGKPLP